MKSKRGKGLSKKGHGNDGVVVQVEVEAGLTVTFDLYVRPSCNAVGQSTEPYPVLMLSAEAMLSKERFSCLDL